MLISYRPDLVKHYDYHPKPLLSQFLVGIFCQGERDSWSQLQIWTLLSLIELILTLSLLPSQKLWHISSCLIFICLKSYSNLLNCQLARYILINLPFLLTDVCLEVRIQISPELFYTAVRMSSHFTLLFILP